MGNKNRAIDLSVLTFLEYLLALLILLASNSIYWVASNKPFKAIIVLLLYSVLLCIVVCCLFNLRKNTDIKKLIKLLMVNFFISIVIVFYNKLTDNVSMQDILRMVVFPLGMIVYFYYYLSKKIVPKIFFVLGKLIFWLACMSLFFYILYFLGILQLNSSLFMDWGTPRWVQGIYYLHFFPQNSVQFLGLSIMRNTGIYSEAPMFSFVLSIGIIILCFIEKPKKIVSVRMVLLTITLITTTSTTGLILLISIVILKLFISAQGYYKVSILAIIPIVAVIIYIILKSKFINMQGSTSIRINDFYAGYQAFLQKPLMGNGMVNGGIVIKRYMDFSRLTLWGNDGFSSGLFYGMARIGFLGMLLYIFIPFCAALRKNQNIATVSLLLFILFVVTIIFSSYLFAFFLSFLFTLLAFKKEELSEFN